MHPVYGSPPDRILYLYEKRIFPQVLKQFACLALRGVAHRSGERRRNLGVLLQHAQPEERFVGERVFSPQGTQAYPDE